MNVHPVLPGFHPDPTICRAGEDYYLATSSFEYFPGVPLFHSRDLTGWRQIGNILDRSSQLSVEPGLAGAGQGIYAPALRHHDGVFWLVTTNITDIRKGHLIVRATDPAGPWSDPVHTEGAIGMDPDLFWDEDGTCHLTWALPTQGIMQATVDPYTGRLLSAPQLLWKGTGLSDPEGPHIIARNGWWYLLIAEGGTGHGHAVTVARSRAVTGPYEAHPGGPILSHRSTDHPVQNTGHADLVELPDGRWAMVHLGVRPGGSFPKWHVNGRETFLVGVEWVDDWPVVVEDAFPVTPAPTAFVDEFAEQPLHPRWIAPGVDPNTFAHPRDTGGITLLAGRAAEHREARHLLSTRAQDRAWQAEVTVPEGDAAVVVRVDDAHWAGVERRGDVVSARMVVGPLDQVLGTETGVPRDCPLVVRTTANTERYSFRQGPDRIRLGFLRDGAFHGLADVDGRYLSTEVAGGFTGRVVGVEALDGDARVTRFAYTPRQTET